VETVNHHGACRVRVLATDKLYRRFAMKPIYRNASKIGVEFFPPSFSCMIYVSPKATNPQAPPVQSLSLWHSWIECSSYPRDTYSGVQSRKN
jgi:hypothetical protein